jgi:hypothetical protein
MVSEVSEVTDFLPQMLRRAQWPVNATNIAQVMHFGKLIEAWQRQLPQLTCPLRFEGRRLFRRHRPERRGAEAKWEECAGIQWVERWLAIPEVFATSAIEASAPILAVVFLGVVSGRHHCRPATPEELQRPDPELPIKEPTGFMFARQRFCEFLAEVFGV